MRSWSPCQIETGPRMLASSTPWTNAGAAVIAVLALVVAAALTHRHRQRVTPGAELPSEVREFEHTGRHH